MCELDWCERRGRNPSGSGLCEAHYCQKRRGRPFTEVRQHLPASTPCVVDGCENTGFTGRYCPKHEVRIRRHGDPHTVIEPKDRKHGRQHESPNWTGDEATSGAVHQRLRTVRGPAAGNQCADCGSPAAHWSYDHNDPAERWDETPGRERWYSVNLGHYSPRCVQCHKRYDLAVIARRATR